MGLSYLGSGFRSVGLGVWSKFGVVLLEVQGLRAVGFGVWSKFGVILLGVQGLGL